MTFTLEKQTVINIASPQISSIFAVFYSLSKHYAFDSEFSSDWPLSTTKTKAEELLVENYLQICRRWTQNITRNTWGQWKSWSGIQEFLHIFNWWSSSAVLRISVFGLLFKLSAVVWFSFLCFGFFLRGGGRGGGGGLFGFGFCVKAYLQQILQNRLKRNNSSYAIESFLHYFSHYYYFQPHSFISINTQSEWMSVL